LNLDLQIFAICGNTFIRMHSRQLRLNRHLFNISSDSIFGTKRK